MLKNFNQSICKYRLQQSAKGGKEQSCRKTNKLDKQLPSPWIQYMKKTVANSTREGARGTKTRRRKQLFHFQVEFTQLLLSAEISYGAKSFIIDRRYTSRSPVCRFCYHTRKIRGFDGSGWAVIVVVRGPRNRRRRRLVFGRERVCQGVVINCNSQS